ncbi:hypothetical protein MKW92_007664, partial [Papaver armeniacum]
IRLRDLSHRAKEYLGFLPRTNENDKEEYVAYSDAFSPSSTAAKATTFWDAFCPISSTAAKAKAFWDASAAANATTFCETPSPTSTAAANATIFFG